jgi:hypothetical protein
MHAIRQRLAERTNPARPNESEPTRQENPHHASNDPQHTENGQVPVEARGRRTARPRNHDSPPASATKARVIGQCHAAAITEHTAPPEA